MKKEKIKISVETRRHDKLGWFRAYIAKEEKNRAVLADGREIIKQGNKWVYIVD